MARYFFHVKDGHDFPDELGAELANSDAVKSHALKTAGEMLRDGTAGGGTLWSGHPWTMTVIDEKGDSVLTLRFSAEQHQA